MLITKKPYVTVLDTYHYKLLTDFTVVRDNGEVITVPADYVTNGADIPRFFWRLFPPYSHSNHQQVLSFLDFAKIAKPFLKPFFVNM